jgi:superfamily I DNA/RNA helicase
MAIVGDDRQAIYSFRGADAGSLDRLKAELGAHELGLTVTYRCGRNIVDLAATIVPDFQAGPANPEGSILGLNPANLVAEAAAGDFILSRTNAPLVSTAMALLRQGKRTKIAGRDIGAGLKSLVTKLSRTARSVPEFVERLEGWAARECKRASKLKNPEAKIDQILDQKETLASLTDGARNVAEITSRIDALFTDNGLGANDVITCSSVHRSKGLEADRVFILTETLRNNSIEEENIRYVAITRAKHTLVWVGENNPIHPEQAAA